MYARVDVHIVDPAADASAVLNADAKRGSCGHSSHRQCSKCWSTGAADSGLLRLSTTTKDVAISGQAHIIDKAILCNRASGAVLETLPLPFVLLFRGTVNMALCHYNPDLSTFDLQECGLLTVATAVALMDRIQVMPTVAGRHEGHCA